MKTTFFVLIIIVVSCKSTVNDNSNFSISDRQIIENFAKKLTKSINDYQYDLIKVSWDNSIFRTKVDKLDKTELNVFNHYFDKDFSKIIVNNNIDLINKLKYNNGQIYLSKLDFFDKYAEITYSLIYNYNIDFCRYRVELVNKIPKLTDFYNFKDEIWLSQNMKNIIRLNSNYRAGSTERRQANTSLINSDKYLKSGDTLKALDCLYQIPETHLIGNNLSLRKINLAYNLHDSIFYSVLYTEKELNKSIYIKYLYSYFYNDTLEMSKIFDYLENEIEKNNIIDSLRTMIYFWN